MKNYRLIYTLLLGIFAVNMAYGQNTLTKAEKKGRFQIALEW